MLQCVAACLSVLQCIAVCCSVSQCAGLYCSVLQCVAVCLSVRDFIAVCGIDTVSVHGLKKRLAAQVRVAVCCNDTL